MAATRCSSSRRTVLHGRGQEPVAVAEVVGDRAVRHTRLGLDRAVASRRPRVPMTCSAASSSAVRRSVAGVAAAAMGEGGRWP